jgi:glycosyltransferase involved in cell wall biosynthesis
MKAEMRYLLVTHIPFAREVGETVKLDGLWAEDLMGLVKSVGPITIAAPQIDDPDSLQSWGPGFTVLGEADNINFIGLPVCTGHFDLLRRIRRRNMLRAAVRNADLIHTSNLFDPKDGLYFAHDYAVKSGKKTLFVVAEDLYDMLQWEQVRTERHPLKRWIKQYKIDRFDRGIRRRVASSSLTFLHTPAAVERYRAYAINAVAIRQAVHEIEDVISPEQFQKKCEYVLSGCVLQLVTACRIEPLKGLDMLIRAVSILNSRGIEVRVRLYGRGRQLARLKALATWLDVAHLVDFPGSVQGASLREAIATGNVFLMPHLTSDFGRAFFDAIAGGNPVIAFRSIASQDTVRDGVDGKLAANADPESLADCIAQFHRDRSMLICAAEAARLRALENTKTFWNAYRASMIREIFVD